jgi:hypothetical protein
MALPNWSLDVPTSLEDVPNQYWGILAGVVVFCCTITSVAVLLVKGGSFTRMQEQVHFDCASFCEDTVLLHWHPQSPESELQHWVLSSSEVPNMFCAHCMLLLGGGVQSRRT